MPGPLGRAYCRGADGLDDRLWRAPVYFHGLLRCADRSAGEHLYRATPGAQGRGHLVPLRAGRGLCITDTFREKDITFTECDTWTTDAIFRETVDKVRRCRSEGCGVVDMECAALSAVAEFRNVQFGQFLFVADTLADAEAYDARNWGADSLVPAMMLCIEIAGREA